MVNSLFDITGKKAIVTGGTRGLGKGMAEGLMESGAEVAIIGTSDKVYQVADEFKARGFVCYGVKADLSDRDQCNEAFNKCVELLGDLDILVPAHGIQRRHPSNEFPDKDWDDVINTNLNSVFWLSRAASNIFKAKGYGKIIMIASMCSWFGGKTVPAYSAAKGGVMQLCKAFSNDLLQYGINVNAIAPGYMDTEMNVALTDPKNPKFTQQRYDELTQRIPAHRWGTPDDMKGIKFRTTTSDLRLAVFEALGAQPVSMSFSEVFTGLQQNVINGQENPPTLIYASGFQEVQKYLTLDNHVHNFLAVLTNENWLYSLSADDQQLVKDCVAEMVTTQRSMELEDNDAVVAKLQDAGMEINELTDEQYQAFVDAVQPMYDEYKQQWGTEIFDLATSYNK